MNNLLDILNKSVNYLEKKNVKNPRIMAETVFSQSLGMDRIMLYANFERKLSDIEIEKIKRILNEKILNYEVTDDIVFEKNNIAEKDKKENLKTLIDKSVSYLEKNNIEEAKLKAEIIFSHILSIDRMMLFTKYNDIPDFEKMDKIRNFIQKVGKEKFPVQYLLNEQEFYGRKFYVDKGVLIPRSDTEILVEEAVRILKENQRQNNPKILDIGTGSGVIGITLALEISGSKVMGTDISDKALKIAEKNKMLLNAANIKFLKSDLFQNIEYKNFNMIISNPPYISNMETNVMSGDTLIHEPDEALFASNEGLYFYNEISEKAMEYLENEGYLLFETGYRQAEIVKKIMEKSGYKNVNIIKDMQNIERVVTGEKI